MKTPNPTCADCQFFVPPSPGERHAECHAPVPMWVHAEFNYVPGAVDANFPAGKCGLFAAAAPAGGGTPTAEGKSGSAGSPSPATFGRPRSG